MIVVDSNILAARVLTSDVTDLAQQVEEADPVWLVPRLWRYEFLNILATQIKVGRMKAPAALRIWQTLINLLSNNEGEPPAAHILDLVARHRITAYDAHFVALAQINSCRLITEDGKLQRKFPLSALSMRAYLDARNSSGWVRESAAPYGQRAHTPKATRKAQTVR